MHNLHPPPKIPAGMFDIANGYYDPDSGKVYTYSVRQSRRPTLTLLTVRPLLQACAWAACLQGAELRIADEKERAFIMKYCRKDMSRGKD